MISSGDSSFSVVKLHGVKMVISVRILREEKTFFWRHKRYVLSNYHHASSPVLEVLPRHFFWDTRPTIRTRTGYQCFSVGTCKCEIECSVIWKKLYKLYGICKREKSLINYVGRIN